MTNKRKIDFDELVFDKRNKGYGAYLLRKKYDDHLMAGLTLGVALLIGLLAIPYLSRLGKSDPLITDRTIPAPTFIINPLIVEPPAKKTETTSGQKAQGGMQQQTVANRTLQMSARPDSQAPTPEELDGLQPGLNNNPGNGNNPYELPGDGGDGENDGGKGGEGEETMGRFVKLEKEPEFPGGPKAMYEFLKTHIRYPERAKQMGIEGTVYIGFVVDEYGNIRFAKVARGIGGGCDEEALRVVNKMPRWIPGRQAGHPVKVSLSLPVSYSLM